MTMRNLVTDIPGILVGHAHDAALRSGVTAIVFERPAIAAVDVRGGGPGTRETDLLALENTVDSIDALVFSGGSAFGLDAAGGVVTSLAERGRGFAVGPVHVPIVPGAILFDLTNGGDKDWGRDAPYRDLGHAAAANARSECALGSAGAGFGATTVNLRGGIGSASAEDESGVIVGALAVVNAAGGATLADGPHFWAAPFERGDEFGGLGLPIPVPREALNPPSKGLVGAATTLAFVATDAVLSKPQAHRFAVMAQDGLARALYPVHTPLDGDAVFAASTGAKPLDDPIWHLSRLGTLAAVTLARAVARAVYSAGSSKGMAGMPPAWTDRFG